MKKKLMQIVPVILVLSMVLAACAQPTEAPAATQAPVETEAPVATEAPTEAPVVYKLAAIFPGVITDADYNTLAYIGVSEVTRTMGIESTYSESVAVPDVDRVMREYIDLGYNVIWTHGGQFVTQTVELAKAFPDVIFIAEGDAAVAEPPANLWFIDRNFQVGYYGIATAAALATKTGKIAYLGGQSLTFSYQEVHAIEQALKDMGSTVEFKAVWTGDFNDPTKARQTADALIAEGYDVIMSSLNLGVYGVFEAAKAVTDKQILVTVKYTDKASYAPNNYVTSEIYDFAKPLQDIIGKIQAGETGGYYPLGFDTGVKVQLPLKNVDASIQATVEETVQKVIDGTITVVEDSTEIAH